MGNASSPGENKDTKMGNHHTYSIGVTVGQQIEITVGGAHLRDERGASSSLCGESENVQGYENESSAYQINWYRGSLNDQRCGW